MSEKTQGRILVIAGIGIIVVMSIFLFFKLDDTSNLKNVEIAASQRNEVNPQEIEKKGTVIEKTEEEKILIPKNGADDEGTHQKIQGDVKKPIKKKDEGGRTK